MIWIEKTSKEAVNGLEDHFYDVVYIDGRHEYEYVLEDIKNYLPKLKKGGIIIGDDYFEQEWHDYLVSINKWGRGEPGVTKAVKEYCSKHNISFNVAYPFDREQGGALKWWWRISS